jgi:hypothetical protein
MRYIRIRPFIGTLVLLWIGCLLNDCISNKNCYKSVTAFTNAPLPKNQFVDVQTVRQQSIHHNRDAITLHRRHMKNQNNNNNDEFWNLQKELVYEMKDIEQRSKKQIALSKYRQRAIALISDTAFIGFYIFCSLWICCINPFIPFSFALGASCGVAYAFGLSKFVESIGGSIDDYTSSSNDDGIGDSAGAGLGAARFAFLLLLFLFVGKFRSYGLMEIPAILGFFTYQLASLSQGLREIND